MPEIEDTRDENESIIKKPNNREFITPITLILCRQNLSPIKPKKESMRLDRWSDKVNRLNYSEFLLFEKKVQTEKHEARLYSCLRHT